MRKITSVLRDEKGAALIYVMMIIMVIAIFVPVLLQMSSTSALNMNRSKNDKLAYNVAVSSMETFIAYLSAIPSTSNRITFFNNYSGWGQRTLTTPEGNAIDYKLYLSTADPNLVTSTYNPAISLTAPDRYTVIARATAGKMIKEITYGFDVLNLAGGDVAPGGVSSFNTLLNYTNGENPYDTNQDNVVSWDEIKASRNEETFNDFYVALQKDLIGESYHYTFDNPSAMINFMKTNAALKDQAGQISIACNCSAFDFSDIVPKGEILDFITGYKASAFVISFSNDVSQNAGNWNIMWKMKGMVMVNGDLSLGDKFFDVSNVVVNGTFEPGNGDKQDTYLAVNNYNSASSMKPNGAANTVNYSSIGGSLAWNPAPGD